MEDYSPFEDNDWSNNANGTTAQSQAAAGQYDWWNKMTPQQQQEYYAYYAQQYAAAYPGTYASAVAYGAQPTASMYNYTTTAYTPVQIQPIVPKSTPTPPKPKFPTPKSAPKKAPPSKEPKPEPPKPAQKSDDDKWPPSLRSYIERAFKQCAEDEAARNWMEAELKTIITSAIAKKELSTKDWDREPLPRQPKPPTPQKQKKDKWQKNKKQMLDLSSRQEDDKREKRLKRFNVGRNDYSHVSDDNNSDDEESSFDDVIKGTSTTLEKQYLRLTSNPDPSTVRPEPVLQKSLEMLKDKWRKSPDYAYVCEQLKSIRQDLTLQRIKNAFAVHVYEIHARLALENRDVGEFNQCQTQLHELYRLGIAGNYQEFVAYRIIYSIHLAGEGDVMKLVAGLTSQMREQDPVAHALKLRAAVACNNYHTFFKLYANTPNLGSYLIDLFVNRIRVLALRVMCKGYNKSIPISFVAQELAFSNLEEVMTFLESHKAVLTDDNQSVQTTATYKLLPDPELNKKKM